MPQPIRKTIAIRSNDTRMIDTRTSSVTNPAVINVNHQSSDHAEAIYEFSFNLYFYDFHLFDNWQLVDASLTFSYALADTPEHIGSVDVIFMVLDSAFSPLAGRTFANLTAMIGGGITAGSVTLTGDERSKVTVSLTDVVDDMSEVIELANDNAVPTAYIMFAIKKSNTSEGYAQVGGETLLDGIAEDWEAAGAGEITDPPVLTLVVEFDQSEHPIILMAYTTSDPMTSQSTPSNSIGGYAKNEVYTSDELGDSLSSTQTTITVAGTPAETSGLLQVGPEIARYTGVSGDQITGVTRGVSPPAGLPSSTEPFADRVAYLSIADLFDTPPTRDLVKYRCVAVQVTSVIGIKNVETFVVQDPDSNVQLDVAIEVPATDTHIGTHTGDTSASITDSTSFVGVGATDGQYDGAAVIVDEDSSRIGIIERFDVSGDTVTITFTDTNLTITNGETYRIISAQSQRINNEVTSPSDSIYFGGFLSSGGTSEVQLIQHGSRMQQYDLFYLWLKLTYSSNADSSDSTGAVVGLKYNEHVSTVTSVTYVDVSTADWTFSDTVTSFTNPSTELELFIDSLWRPPDTTSQVSSNTLRCSYSGSQTDGLPTEWRILEESTIAFSSGAPLKRRVTGFSGTE